MATATLHQEIKELKQRQTRLEQKVTKLLKERDLPYDTLGLKPSAIRRIEKARKEIGASKGAVLNNAEAIRRHFAKQLTRFNLVSS